MTKEEVDVWYPTAGLSIGQYLALEIRPDPTSAEDVIYDLFAVICHRGTANFGQYWTLGKGKDDVWYEFDDTQIKKIDTEDVKTPNAYILFYERKEIK